jgi:hypothetical protein
MEAQMVGQLPIREIPRDEMLTRVARFKDLSAYVVGSRSLVRRARFASTRRQDRDWTEGHQADS